MIVIDQYWPAFLKQQDFSAISEHGVSINNAVAKENWRYLVSWGESISGTKHGVLESGFFKDGAHIDTVGLYTHCSLNFPFARQEIERLSVPRRWFELGIESKFGQPPNPPSWDGFVLGCQHPNDRSILKVGSRQDYHDFVERACRRFGPKLFLKKHPVTLGMRDEMDFLESMASTHGCEIGHVGADVVSDCSGVLLYNSTFAVDALMRGVQVYQYAPGYFWQTGAVKYLAGSLAIADERLDRAWSDCFLDFLLWRYCFNLNAPIGQAAEIVKIFASSTEYFPLPAELSYGAFIMNNTH